jgi:hypothetical protein
MKITGTVLASLQREGMSKSELCQLYNLTRQEFDKKVKADRPPAEFDVIHLGTPFDLSGDFVVVGDVHVPATDWQFSRMVGMVADKLGIYRLIIAGDFFNFDFASKYRIVVPPATWREERDAARILIADWLETFTEIYILQGNHDRRLTNWSAGEFDEVDIWGMVNSSSKIKVSKFGWLTVNSGGIPWRITHPTSYGVNQLTVASDLANKYQMNICGHHEHHFSVGWDKYKHFVVVNNGGLMDPNKLAYVHLDDNRCANMMQGFTVLRNGCPTLFGRYPFTDWGRVLG